MSDDAPADKKPTDLKLLSFPKPEGALSTDEGMGFDIIRITVKSDDANRVMEFLQKHAEELPPTVPHLLGLIWTAARTLLQDLPAENVSIVCHEMITRAVTWVPEEQAPPPVSPPRRRAAARKPSA